MDIDKGIREKKLMKILIRTYHKFCKKPHEIQYDLENTGDPLTGELYKIVKKIAESTYEKPQADCFRHPLELGLWTTAKDSAYQDQRNYALWLILTEHGDKLKQYLTEEKNNNDFTNPDNWYCNRWYKSKQKTQQLKKDGLIMDGMVSIEEAQFINDKHTEDVKNFIKRKK